MQAKRQINQIFIRKYQGAQRITVVNKNNKSYVRKGSRFIKEHGFKQNFKDK